MVQRARDGPLDPAREAPHGHGPWQGNEPEECTRKDLAGLPPISRTLLLPLLFRALETTRQTRPLLNDPWAARLVDRIEYDFAPLAAHDFTQLATVLRTREIDRRVRTFLREHTGTEATVVNLGCGLDTRFLRVDDGAVRWLDLDLAEVVALRRRLLPETPRTRCLSGDALDPAWMETLPTGGPLFFLAEGFLPYLAGSQVEELVRRLCARFPGSELLFDAVTPFQAWMSPLHPTLGTVNSFFRWGLERTDELEAWCPGIRLLFHSYYLEDPEPRLDPYRWLLLLPVVSRGFSVLQYRLGELPGSLPARAAQPSEASQGSPGVQRRTASPRAANSASIDEARRTQAPGDASSRPRGLRGGAQGLP